MPQGQGPTSLLNRRGSKFTDERGEHTCEVRSRITVDVPPGWHLGRNGAGLQVLTRESTGEELSAMEVVQRALPGSEGFTCREEPA